MREAPLGRWRQAQPYVLTALLAGLSQAVCYVASGWPSMLFISGLCCGVALVWGREAIDEDRRLTVERLRFLRGEDHEQAAIENFGGWRRHE